MSFLSLNNISKKYHGKDILKNISLSADQGDFVVIVGPSGCGKSTLLKCISGVESLDGGNISLDGEDISFRPPEKRPVTMVWQTLALFPHFNVYENIEFGLKLRLKNKHERKQRITPLLELLNLGKHAQKQVHHLSQGERQRVAIGRALAVNPKVILLDEPFSALDAHIALTLKNEIKLIQQKLGITFIMVTHNIAEAFALANKLVIMNEGKIIEAGNPQEIYESTTPFVNSFIGHQVSVDVLRGYEGMKILFEDMLNYPVNQFICAGAGGGVMLHMPEFWKEWNARRIAKKVLWQDILSVENVDVNGIVVLPPELRSPPFDKNYIKNHLHYQFKIIPKELSVGPHVVFLYGEKVVHVLWEDYPLAFIIENHHVSISFKKYFDYLWQRSREV